MNISFNTYPWAFDVPGGGERQLQFYASALSRGSRKWPDLQISFFNEWQPNLPTVDLLHFFSCMPSSLDFLSYIKCNYRIPLVVSPNFWPDPEGWAASGTSDSIKSILWLADRVIVNSKIEEEALVRLCSIDSSRITIVHNAVDDVFFTPTSESLFRDKFGIRGNYILNVGNVEPRKNQLVLLKALKSFTNTKLVTIGGIRDKWYFDACVEEGGEQFVLLDPMEPGSDILRSSLAGCDFFAMPSLRETPSIASLEAGAAGCKLLTTDLGSTVEYFQDKAVYVNPYDINSIEEGIEEILAQERNASLSKTIYEHYRWDVVVNQLVDAYWLTQKCFIA